MVVKFVVRVSIKRRLLGQREDHVVLVAVVEDARAAADRGLAVAGDVPGKADARRGKDALAVVHCLLRDLHAVVEVARPGDELADVGVVQHLTGQRVLGQARVPAQVAALFGQTGWNRAALSRRQDLRIEVPHVLTLHVRRADVVEAHRRQSMVKLRFTPPVVLREELDLVEAALRERLRRRLRVGLIEPSSALANPKFVSNGLLVLPSKLYVPLKVAARGAGRAVCSMNTPASGCASRAASSGSHVYVRMMFFALNGIAVLEMPMPRVFGSALRAGEAHVRNQVDRVGRREELRQPGKHLRRGRWRPASAGSRCGPTAAPSSGPP